MAFTRRFGLFVLLAGALVSALPAGAAECPQTSISDGVHTQVAKNAPPWDSLRIWVRDPPPSLEAAQAEVDRVGGVRIVYEIDANDVRKQLLDSLRAEIRRVLLDAHIRWTSSPAVRDNAVEVRLRESAEVDRFLDLIAPSARDAEATSLGEGLVRLMVGEAAFAEKLQIARRSAIADLRSRVRHGGGVIAAVEPMGRDRILLVSPGVENTIRALGTIIDWGAISFHFFERAASACEALDRRTSWTSLVVHRPAKAPPYIGDKYVVERRALVDGDDVADAVVALDGRDEPTVVFRLDAAGTDRFAQAVRDHVGQPLAIVFLGMLIAAPSIAEPLTGPVQISGGFSFDEAEQLAAMIGAGPPPRLIEINRETMNPSPVNAPR